jgi:transposase-like protein
MSKHHTEDYKLSAVLYYLSHDKNLRDTCEIFNCKFQSLARWIERYEKRSKYLLTHLYNDFLEHSNISHTLSKLLLLFI